MFAYLWYLNTVFALHLNQNVKLHSFRMHIWTNRILCKSRFSQKYALTISNGKIENCSFNMDKTTNGPKFSINCHLHWKLGHSGVWAVNIARYSKNVWKCIQGWLIQITEFTYCYFYLPTYTDFTLACILHYYKIIILQRST